MTVPQPHSNAVRLLFFWIGITATICYRIIIVFTNIGGPWLKVFGM